MTSIQKLNVCYGLGAKKPRGSAYARLLEIERKGIQLFITNGAKEQEQTYMSSTRRTYMDVMDLLRGLASGLSLDKIANTLRRTLLSIICKLCRIGIVEQENDGRFVWSELVHRSYLLVEIKSNIGYGKRVDAFKVLRHLGWGTHGQFLNVPEELAGKPLGFWYGEYIERN